MAQVIASERGGKLLIFKGYSYDFRKNGLDKKIWGSYFRYSEIAERVRNFNSSMKIMLLVREPILYTISNYMHGISEKVIEYHVSFSRSELDLWTFFCRAENDIGIGHLAYTFSSL